LSTGYVAGRQQLFAARAAAGLAVDGHGDLTTMDVFCLSDGPRALDCLEFDERLRLVDVVDDIAFLAMDLEHLGRRDLSDRLLGWYLEFSGYPSVTSLEHHYIAYRAFVRAKVACIRATQGDTTAPGDVRSYASIALDHLEAGQVTLLLVGGAPATGKTTLAGAIADEYGWVHLSTDAVRRELDLPVSTRYSGAGKQAAYDALLQRARQALARGESVVADATWSDVDSRAAAAEVARETASRFVAVECQAPVDLAAARASHRNNLDYSEAGSDVARLLSAARAPWPQAIAVDTSGALMDALDAALAALAASPAGVPGPTTEIDTTVSRVAAPKTQRT
jgi:predicted kinase